MAKSVLKDGMLLLTNVRVSFPHLFTRPIIKGEEGKCGAALMLDPKVNKDALDLIEAEIQRLTKEKFKGKARPADKLCLRDGDDKDRPEYEGWMVLSASNRKTPMVISNNGRDTITDENDCPIYAGCFVNAKVRLWAQDNNYGKRINAELVAIQFSDNGDPLEDSYVKPEDAMSGFGDTDEDDEFLAA